LKAIVKNPATGWADLLRSNILPSAFLEGSDFYSSFGGAGGFLLEKFI
jgi:hypothetical protein